MTSAPPPAATPAEELGRVQRVDGPDRQTVVLTLYKPGAGRRVLVFDAQRRRVAFATARPAGDAADGFVRRLRKLLPGAVVWAEYEAAAQDGARASGDNVPTPHRLRLEGGGRDYRLTGEDNIPVLRDHDGKPLGGRRRLATTPVNDARWLPFEPVHRELTKTPAGPAHHDWLKLLRGAHKRLTRKGAHIEKDAARVEKAPLLREEAQLLLAYAKQWQGEEEFEVQDWATGAPRMLKVAPARSPQAAAERRFHQAKRLERGAEIAFERAVENEAELEALDALIAKLVAIDESDQELTEQESEALKAEVLAFRSASAKTRGQSQRGQAARLPYRRFRSHGDRAILVGRGAADNDALTLRHSRPQDLWLHARSIRGAHVIVPLERNETPSSELLLDAATLAAHFSEASKDARVEIQYCSRRHIHKRRGAAPGAVVVANEKVLLLELEQDRRERLLANER